MYSPNNYHLRVPRERVKNVRFRKWLLKRCRENLKFRSAVWHMCQTDILFFVNALVWQYNPNAIGKFSQKVGPFLTPVFQEEAIRVILDSIWDRESLVIEKSREMGASWLNLIVLVWFLIFQPDTAFIVISRNEKAVEEESRQSLFTKIAYILDRLPEWIADVRPGKIVKRVGSFVNKENGAEIAGEATTERAAVGGRATAIFVDEFAQIRADWDILDRTANTSASRIFNSTHLGTNTAFFDLCGKTDGSIRKVVMHWSLHPDKKKGLYRFDPQSQRVEYLDKTFKYPANFTPVTDGSPTGGPFPGLRSPWYDKKVKTMTPRAVAADLDINPAGSREQAFSPLLITDLITRYARPGRRMELEYDKQTAEPRYLHDDPAGRFEFWGHLTPLHDPAGSSRLGGRWQPLPGEYAVGADVATGTGATPTTLSLANAKTGEKILEFADSKIEPKEFAHLLVAVGRLFKNREGRGAKLGWEIPGPGNTVTKHVLALMYQPIFFRQTEHRMKREISDSPGWPNSPDSLKSLLENYKTALRERAFLNRSSAALKECLDFIYEADSYIYHTGWKDPKDPSGARHNHGDRTIADAICWKLVDEWGLLAGFDPRDSDPVAAAASDPFVRWDLPPPETDPRGLAGRMRLARMDDEFN